MKKLLTLLVFSLLFSACEPSVVVSGRHHYKAYFNYILNDPKSLEIHKEEYSLDGEVTVNWTIDYSAKNKLGGRVRETIKFTTIGNIIFVEGEGEELPAMYDIKDLI